MFLQPKNKILSSICTTKEEKKEPPLILPSEPAFDPPVLSSKQINRGKDDKDKIERRDHLPWIMREVGSEKGTERRKQIRGDVTPVTAVGSMGTPL